MKLLSQLFLSASLLALAHGSSEAASCTTWLRGITSCANSMVAAVKNNPLLAGSIAAGAVLATSVGMCWKLHAQAKAKEMLMKNEQKRASELTFIGSMRRGCCETSFRKKLFLGVVADRVFNNAYADAFYMHDEQHHMDERAFEKMLAEGSALKFHMSALQSVQLKTFFKNLSRAGGCRASQIRNKVSFAELHSVSLKNPAQ